MQSQRRVEKHTSDKFVSEITGDGRIITNVRDLNGLMRDNDIPSTVLGLSFWIIMRTPNLFDNLFLPYDCLLERVPLRYGYSQARPRFCPLVI